MTKPQASHVMSGWRFRTLIIVIVLSAAGYLAFMFWGGWDDAVGAISRVGYLGLAVALLSSLINYGLRFIRWQVYLDRLNYSVPVWQSLKIYIAGFSLTTTPAKSGEMLRSIFLKDYGVSYHASFGAFLSERLSDLISVLLLALLGLWEYSGARVVCLLTAGAIFLVLVALQQHSWMRGFQRWAIRRLSRRLSRAIYFFVKILLAFRDCFSLKTLFVGTVLGVVAWGAEGAAFYYILRLLDLQVTLSTAIFIYSFSLLIGGISLLPGGLGSAEVTMLQLLIWYQVPSADAVVATVIIRLATLWFAVALGLATLPFFDLRKSL